VTGTDVNFEHRFYHCATDYEYFQIPNIYMKDHYHQGGVKSAHTSASLTTNSHQMLPISWGVMLSLAQHQEASEGWRVRATGIPAKMVVVMWL
jgi:hypothetical protein